MKKLYLWFILNVAACCANAYAFGTDGNLINGAAAIGGFLLYSRAAFYIHLRRKFQLVIEDRKRDELRSSF